MYFSIIYNPLSKSCLNRYAVSVQKCRNCHFVSKREVSWSLPSLDWNFCHVFDLIFWYLKCQKNFLFEIEKCRLVFLSILKKKLSKMSLWKKYFRYLMHLVFLFGILHIKENKNKYMHLHLHLVCVRKMIYENALVCALCSLFERIVIFFP